MREGEREQENCDVQDGAKPMIKIETLLMPQEVRNVQSAHYCYERNVRDQGWNSGEPEHKCDRG